MASSKPPKRGRKVADPELYKQIAAMTKESSVFFEGKRPGDLNNWRRMAGVLGMLVVMRYTQADQVAGAAGTRIWCKRVANKHLLNKVLKNAAYDAAGTDEDDEL